MEWTKYRIKTTTQAEDYIGEILAEEGIYGFEIEDHIPLTEEEKAEMFIDILPELPKDLGEAYISFYMETKEEADSKMENAEKLDRILKKIKELEPLVPVGEAALEISVTKEEDWVNNWKQYFKPFAVDDILIKPTWEVAECPQNYSMVIEMDPGTAFGTGRHETTRLCIRQLKKYLKEGMDVLDAGCGSGILGIIAAKLGAGKVRAVDIDPRAVTASLENQKENQIPEEKMTFSAGNLLEDEVLQKELSEKKFDLVVANIFTEIIVPLCDIVPDFLKKDGIFITSGILNEKRQLVEEAMEKNGLSVVETVEDGDWISVISRKF